MARKKKSAQEEESILGYKEFLADLVGTIQDTMVKTKPLLDEKTFNSMWGIKQKKVAKKKNHERKKI
jgi:hypothetical protein